MKNIIIITLLLLISACQSIKFNTLSAELPKVKYIGKGTQSGPMLMGAMGPAGIAIGIAIDQGISKDIQEQVAQHQPKWLGKVQVALNTHFVSESGYFFDEINLVADKDNDFAIAKVQVSSHNQSVCYSTTSIELEQLKTNDVFWRALLNSIDVNRLCEEKAINAN